MSKLDFRMHPLFSSELMIYIVFGEGEYEGEELDNWEEQNIIELFHALRAGDGYDICRETGYDYDSHLTVRIDPSCYDLKSSWKGTLAEFYNYCHIEDESKEGTEFWESIWHSTLARQIYELSQTYHVEVVV